MESKPWITGVDPNIRVGVTTEAVYELKRIDTVYFEYEYRHRLF